MSAQTPIRSLVIRASAGAGKTYRLTQKIYEALLAPGAAEHPERLLAMTFARAAAGEIRDRVLRELAEAATDDAGFERHRAKLPAGTQREDVRRLLLALIARLDRLRIGTIDAFFMTLARSYAFDLEMPANWRIGDELELSDLRLQALEDVWAELSASEVATLLFELAQGKPSPQVTETVEKLLKSAYEMVRDTPPEAWDWLEPTTWVSDDELRIARAALGAASLEGTATFDNTRRDDLARFDRRDWKAFLTTGIPKAILTGKAYYRSEKNRLGVEVTGRYAPMIAYAQAQLLNALSARTREIRAIVLRYEAALRGRRASSPLFSFGDVAYRLRVGDALGLLDVMAYRLDGRLDHLLLDEFQDTSMDQWDVLRPLARSVTADGEGARSLMAVGDVKQSLYAWRGGRSELLERLTEQLPAFDGDVEGLSKTYRSSPVVLRLVNEVFAKIDSNPACRTQAALAGARRWREGFDEHTAEHQAMPGAADVRVVGESVDPLHAAAELAREIHVARPNASIGILVRGNTKGQIATIVRALGDGEPSVMATGRGGNPLTDSVAVEALVTLLTLMDHPGDGLARFHVWRSPLGRLIAPSSSPSEPADLDACRRFLAGARSRVIEEGYPRLMREWMEPLLGHADAYDIERMSQLLDLLTADSTRPTLRPSEQARLIRDTRVPSPSASNIEVMTIHKSKGLEFDAVILPDLGGRLVQPGALLVHQDDPLLPPEKVSSYAAEIVVDAHPELSAMREAHIAQATRSALCVLYVALTRAKHATHCIIEPSKKTEKRLPETLAGVLRGALAEPGSLAMAGDTLWTAPDSQRHWPLGGAAADVSAPDEPLVWIPPRVDPTSRNTRNLPRTSPSRLEGDSNVLGQRALTFSPRAKTKGTVVHAWLEGLPWLEETPSLSVLVERARELGATEAEAATWADSFLASLARPTLSSLLRRPPGAVEVRVEQPFQMMVEPGVSFAQRTVNERALMSGSMDRMVIYREEARVVRVEVIDYKTDVLKSSDEETIAGRARFYAPQLAVYRMAASRLVGCPIGCVTTGLMLLHLDRMEWTSS